MPYDDRGKRKWLALYEYQKLYPDENILYEKPDFREYKNTCKWCGKELKSKRQKSYCSDDCKWSYESCTVWSRGHSPLAYRILCRDKFICQKCGKFVGLINKFGMKIPTGNGAQVHHKQFVSEGGSDHQSNLITLCELCHAAVHGKEVPKEQAYIKQAVYYYGK